MKKQLLFLLLFVFLLVNVAKAQDPAPVPTTAPTPLVIEDDTPIKIDTLLLTVPLTVSDSKGRMVPGLKKENFSIAQNGDPQDIEFFFNEEEPMNVAILLDTSFSTKEVLDKIQKAARDFLKVFRPEDKGIIVSFDYRTTFLSGLTSDQKQLSKAINQAQIGSRAGSEMHEAVFQVINNHFSSLKGRKAIIVLTDGMVIGRSISTQQTLDILQKSDTLFYPIIFKTNFYSQPKTRNASTKRPLPIELMDFLAEESGGRFYEKDVANLKEAFQSIAEELKKQYLIGFYPQNSGAGRSLGHISIAVDRKDLSVKTKKVAFLKKIAEETK
jgi:VWFA-related protein